MATSENLLQTDIQAYLKAHQYKSMLRFITCGSVDDGKSTMIGRLLYESQLLFEDQLAALQNDSKKFGTQGEELDFALLVDGLSAEREQGITIDVAYRFFATDKRKFIVADTPGHEQYTRNMVTGASTADAAVLMVDARNGIMPQTKRHAYLMSIMGMRHIVVAINKMDLAGYSEQRFEQIQKDFAAFAKELELGQVTFIALSALKGDNVVHPSANMPWYQGPCLLDFLETVEIDDQARQKGPFRMPVQWVNRPNHEFRGFSGIVTNGIIHPGDAIRVQPSGAQSQVKQIYTFDGDLNEAVAGQSITLVLEDEIDISRGNVISSKDQPAEIADQFEATIVWMHNQPLLAGRPYLMKLGTQLVPVSITDIKHRVDVNTLEKLAAKELELNGIGVCTLSTGHNIVFDPFNQAPDTGSFILIDRLTNNTVGAGMLSFALRRAQNIHHQQLTINKQTRADANLQKPLLLWFTGLSGAGKSTIANLVEQKLFALGKRTYLLDGDNVRHGLNRDLGFTNADRVENIRRIIEVSRLMLDAGLIVLTSFISPFVRERRLARERIEDKEFIEIFIDTPLKLAEQRDTKGLYKKVRQGELKNFTGVDSAYERPQNPEIHIRGDQESSEQAAQKIIDYLTQNKRI